MSVLADTGTAMRDCGHPRCPRQFDVVAAMSGEKLAGPWAQNRLVRYLCPDHRDAEHVPGWKVHYPPSKPPLEAAAEAIATCSCGWTGQGAYTVAAAAYQWRVHVLFSTVDVRVLSVQQPWAYSILHMGKDVENRTWEPPGGWTGWMLLHASKKADRQAIADARDDGVTFTADELHLGCVVGAVYVTGHTVHSRSRWAARGQVHWLLRDPVALEQPIPWKGGLGLRHIPDELAYLLPARLVTPMTLAA